MSNITSCNENRGVDYHLNLLGLMDRKDWEILANDNQLFVGSTIRCKPDFVLFNRHTNQIIVIDYKNRLLGAGKPTSYELAEITANALTVDEVIAATLTVSPNVQAILMYGDRQKLHVQFEDQDIDTLLYTAMEFTEPGKTITSSALATIISGIKKNPRYVARARAGVRAHAMLSNGGPTFKTSAID